MQLHPNTLPAEQRLKSKTSIDKLFATGRGGFVYPIRYIVLDECDQSIVTNNSNDEAGICWNEIKRRANIQPEMSVMVTVPKRNHKQANVRNLLKRRIRESYRLNKSAQREWCLSTGTQRSIALMYAVSDVLDYQTIDNAVKKIFSKIAQVG